MSGTSAIIDSLDGSFRLQPDADHARATRRLAIGIAAAGLVGLAVFPILAIAYSTPMLLLGGLAYLLVWAASDWVFWKVLSPPALTADAVSVAYDSGFVRSSVARAELALVLRAQRLVRTGRSTSSIRSYLFCRPDATVSLSVPAAWFRADDMTEFTDRLGVELKGDFSQVVVGRVAKLQS